MGHIISNLKMKFLPVLSIVILLILSALCFTGAKDQSLENRTLASFKMVIDPDPTSVVYNDSFLERFESAMKDQFKFRDRFVLSYLRISYISTDLTKRLLGGASKSSGNQYSYTEIGDYARIDNTDCIIDVPRMEATSDKTIMIHINQIEQIHEMFPHIKFYSYYVTQADDTGWFNDYLGIDVPDLYDQVEKLLPDYVASTRLSYEDLDDYIFCHYKSDHHWNHNGSRRGYEDTISLMRVNLDISDAREPVREWDFSQYYNLPYKGSYARRLGELYEGTDDFCIFEYDLPQRNVYAINPDELVEIPLKELGLFDSYKSGVIDASDDYYRAFYGQGITLYDNKVTSDTDYIYVIKNIDSKLKHNLLIYGDSYDRAMRDTLASHFNTTIYFQRDILEKYSNVYIDDIIKKYDIDVILFSGNDAIWITDAYIFDFSGDRDREGMTTK